MKTKVAHYPFASCGSGASSNRPIHACGNNRQSNPKIVRAFTSSFSTGDPCMWFSAPGPMQKKYFFICAPSPIGRICKRSDPKSLAPIGHACQLSGRRGKRPRYGSRQWRKTSFSGSARARRLPNVYRLYLSVSFLFFCCAPGVCPGAGLLPLVRLSCCDYITYDISVNR
jgi:hypothetical protein